MDSRFTVKTDLEKLCTQIRELLPKRKFDECERLLSTAMRQYPDAPQPHNLYGLLFEAKGDHRTAMNYFRAARVLDDTYMPAQHNLNHFGTFYSRGKWAYDESDCCDENKEAYVIESDADGIGQVVKSVPCGTKQDSNGARKK